MWQSGYGRASVSDVDYVRPAASINIATTPQGQKPFVFEAMVAGDYTSRLREVRNRPLFSENRRLPKLVVIEEQPDEQEPTVVENPENAYDVSIISSPPPQLSYQGFLRRGNNIVALLILEPTSEEVWVSVGSIIQGWVVIETSDTFIRLEYEGTEHAVALEQ